MGYFKNAKKGDKVFGMIFGEGKIIKVFDFSYYVIEVEFKNGSNVMYTEDGIPNWGKFNDQTLFYFKDVNLSDIDFSPSQRPIKSYNKIVKLRVKNQLEVRCHSGVWLNANLCEENYLESMLEKNNFHLFRKIK